MHVVSVPFETVFQSLSDPLRLRIVRVLIAAGEEACSCELADTLLEPEYKLSKHMKVLRQAGLVSTEKQGRWVYHRLVMSNPVLKALYRTIDQLPDADKSLAKDMMRFRKRMNLREDGRCCVGPSIQQSSDKKAK